MTAIEPVEASFDEALSALRSTAARAPSLPKTLDQRAHLITAMRADLSKAWPEATIAAIAPCLFSARTETSNIPAGSAVKLRALEPLGDAMIAVTEDGRYWITVGPGMSMTIEVGIVRAVTQFDAKVSIARCPGMQIETGEDGESDYTHIVLDDLPAAQALEFLQNSPAFKPTPRAAPTGPSASPDRRRVTNRALVLLGAVAVAGAAMFAYSALSGGAGRASEPTALPVSTRDAEMTTFGPMDPQQKELVLGWTIGTGNWGPLVAGGGTVQDALHSGAFLPGSEGACAPARFQPELIEAWGGQDQAPKVAWGRSDAEPRLLGVAFTNPAFATSEGIRVGSTLDDVRRAYGVDLRPVRFDWVVEPEVTELPGVGTGAWTLFQINDSGAVEAIMIVPKTGENSAENVFLGVLNTQLWRGGLYWATLVLGVVVLTGVMMSLRTTVHALESRRELQIALEELADGRPSAAGERAGAVIEDWPTSRNAWQVGACGHWAEGEFDLAMAHFSTLRATGYDVAAFPGCQPTGSAPSIVSIDYGGGLRGGVVVPALEPERAQGLPTDDDLRATAAEGATARLLLQAACRHQHHGWRVTTGVLLRLTRFQAGPAAQEDLAWLLATWPACADEPT